MDETVTFYTLIGKRQLECGLRCLPTLPRFATGGRVLLKVLDDGSFTREDFSRLQDAVLTAGADGCRWIERSEVNDRCTGVFPTGAFPNIARYREAHALAIKLIDLSVVHDDQAPVSFVDSDVLFRRHFDLNSIACLDSGVDVVFMRDSLCSYSPRSWTLALHGIKLARFVNTGLMTFKPSIVHLDRIERFLSMNVPHHSMHLMEQSAFAHLATFGRWSFFDHTQVRLVHPSFLLSESTVALHYVTTYRHLLFEGPNEAVDSSTFQVVAIRRAEGSEIYGGLGRAVEEIRRFASRRFAFIPSARGGYDSI